MLHYLAAEGVVHLDVKPRNIIMAGVAAADRPERRARGVDELGLPARPVGTDAYMAPEQCDPARFGEIGPPTDVWGLGATLHEAIAGERPFPRPAEPLPAAARGARPLPGRGVPPALAELVAGVPGRRDPADRPRRRGARRRARAARRRASGAAARAASGPAAGAPARLEPHETAA